MSIRERKPGVWDVTVYDYARLDGTRPRYTKRVRGGKREARDAERELLNLRAAHQLARPTTTVKSYINGYLKDRTGQVSPKTLHSEKYLAEKHVIPRLGVRKMQAVTPPMIRKLYDELSTKGLSGTTIQKDHKFLKAVWKQAMTDGVVSANVVAAVKAPRLDTKEKRALTPDEAKALLKKLEGTPLRTPAMLALTTGMRPGEVKAAKWEDFDLEAGVVHIGYSLEQIESTVRRKETKTEREQRSVTLPPVMVRELKRHRGAQAEMRLQHANAWDDQGYVFPSTSKFANQLAGRPWSGFDVAWRKAKTGVTFHELRHTHLTWLLANGMRMEAVSRRAGHSSSGVTADVYRHVLPGEDAEATAIVDGLL